MGILYIFGVALTFLYGLAWLLPGLLAIGAGGFYVREYAIDWWEYAAALAFAAVGVPMTAYGGVHVWAAVASWVGL